VAEANAIAAAETPQARYTEKKEVTNLSIRNKPNEPAPAVKPAPTPVAQPLPKPQQLPPPQPNIQPKFGAEQPMPKLNSDEDTVDFAQQQRSLASTDSIASTFKTHDTPTSHLNGTLSGSEGKQNGHGYLATSRNDDKLAAPPKRGLFRSILCEIL
jgi:hypothetical protein